jgi:putative addiction module component (TIGR02574 family)
VVKPISSGQILALSVPERIRLIQAVWDSILDSPETLPVTDRERKTLDARLDAYRKDNEAGRPWRESLRKLKSRS